MANVGTIVGGEAMWIECVIFYEVSALTVSYIVLIYESLQQPTSHYSLGNRVCSRQRSVL